MKFVSLVALWALSAGSLLAQLSGVPYPITNGDNDNGSEREQF